ncbi:helix-turn-helix domain-containing protein [Streptococcus pneumoniae]
MYVINVCDVGKRIKELRISSNLTQDKIAEYLSLNQSMIAKMEPKSFIPLSTRCNLQNP